MPKIGQAGRKRKGTAAKSLTLTYAQLEFLDGLDNASAWVREAIDEIREIRQGKKVVLDRPPAESKGTYWARLVEKGLGERGKLSGTKGPFDQIIEAGLNLEEAHNEAERMDKAEGGNGEKPFKDFYIPAYQVARDIEKIIKDGQESRP